MESTVKSSCKSEPRWSRVAKVLISSCAALSLAAACGGGTQSTGDTTPTTDPNAGKPEANNDVNLDFQPATLVGTVFVPEGLGRPGMIRTPKKGVKLDKQRDAYKKAAANAKATEGKVLA